MIRNADIPIILFGAFDRHNFGDLLFPHVVAALLPRRKLIFAGLAERDLRRFGGHRVRALARLAEQWGSRPVDLVHVGGELLTCTAWQAAVMLMPCDRAQETIARFEARPHAGMEWARGMLGLSALAPYTVSRALLRGAGAMIYNAVGGVDLDECEPAQRAEVLANLAAADAVGVRDRQTYALLTSAGIAARLMPDPAVMVAGLFGATIRERARRGEVARVRQDFPRGYIAVQFSADFGDDKTLSAIAGQLDRVARSSGHGIVLFRAGAAPWHDDPDCYRRLVARMRAPAVKIFGSLHLWDICALIAGSRAYAGSSLHGRIVAMAFALPRINLRPPGQGLLSAKQDAFAATWEAPGLPATVDVHEIALGMRQALSVDAAQLRDAAAELVARYRQGFAALGAALQ